MAILLSLLLDGILREVADEKIVAELWKKLKRLYMKKSSEKILQIKR
jgi:hypothetical protein